MSFPGIQQQTEQQTKLLTEIRDLLKTLVERPQFDPHAPVNQYGESFTEAIQNSFVRGQRGIHTHG